MIHYHGLPLGGRSDEAARFLVGRHAFISFADATELVVAAEVCQSFAIDNGAFAVWKRGEVLDPEAYLAFVVSWATHPGFDFCILPDVINGGDKENDALLERWAPAFADYNGVPVWHYDETLERLGRLCAQYQRVAIGSTDRFALRSVGWWRRTAEAFDVITDGEGRARCKVHGLRMLDPRIFTRLPLASADSTVVGRNFTREHQDRWGTYRAPSQRVRAAVLADRIEHHNSSPRWARHNQPSLFDDL